MSLRLDEIVARLGGQLAGSGDVRVLRVATLDGAGRGDLSFLFEIIRVKYFLLSKEKKTKTTGYYPVVELNLEKVLRLP